MASIFAKFSRTLLTLPKAAAAALWEAKYYGLLVVALAAFWFWSSPRFSASQKVHLSFWTGFTGPDGETMLRLVQRFNEENPDVEVSIQRIPWATYYNKLFVAGISGRGPDVYVLHSSVVPRFESAGLMAPLDAFADHGAGAVADDLIEEIRPLAFRDGRMMALPLDVHMLVVFCNLELFRQAGLVDASGPPQLPTDRESFLAAAEAIRALDGRDGERWGFSFYDPVMDGQTLIHQFGGKVVDEADNVSLLNSEANAQALGFMRDLVSPRRVTPVETFDGWIGFRQGRVGMILVGIWMLGELKGPEQFDFEVIPVPQLGKQRAVWANSHFLCMSPAEDEARAEASWRLMQFLSDNTLEWVQIGQFPARKSVLQSAEFAAIEPQASLAVQIPDMIFNPAVEYQFEALYEVGRSMELGLRGALSPERALEDGDRRITEVIRRWREQKARMEAQAQ